MRRPTTRGSLPLLLLLAGVPAASFPRSPEELRCPEGTAKQREESDRGIHVGCLRPDGVPIGPQAAWHPNGQLSEFRTFVAQEEWSAIHGLDIAWQPDGSKWKEGYWDHGKAVGEHVSWFPSGRVFTRLYESGMLLDVYEGRARPRFTCASGWIPRVRTSHGGGGWVVGVLPPLRPFIEHWCEDPEEPARFPAPDTSLRAERVTCQVTTEGIVSSSARKWGGGHTDRLPLPPGFDPDDARAVGDLCRRPDFWREHRREGPYSSRGERGEPYEEGRFVRGRRDGIWTVRGRACVRWSNGELQGRARCPTGDGPSPDPWVAARWEKLARITERLGWPPLEAGSPEEREVRIWRFPAIPSYAVPAEGQAAPRVLRLRISAGEARGELATWEVPPKLRGACHVGDGKEVCSFTRASAWEWEGVAYELGLLDVWALPTASSIRVPAVAREPGGNRSGFFAEVLVEGRVNREWFGPVRDEPFEGTHQTRGIAMLADQLWREVASNPPPLEPRAEEGGCDPWVEITASAQRVAVGEPVTIRVRARARLGLEYIWWAAQREDRRERPSHSGHFAGNREQEVERETVEVFEEPGRVLLRANARDARYGLHIGHPHQASEGCGLGSVEIEVVPAEQDDGTTKGESSCGGTSGRGLRARCPGDSPRSSAD